MSPVDKVVYGKSQLPDCNTLAYRKCNKHLANKRTKIVARNILHIAYKKLFLL